MCVLNVVLKLAERARDGALDDTSARRLVYGLISLSCAEEAMRVANQLGVCRRTITVAQTDADKDLSTAYPLYPPVVLTSTACTEPTMELVFHSLLFVHTVRPTVPVRISYGSLKGWYMLVLFASATDLITPTHDVGFVENSCVVLAAHHVDDLVVARRKLLTEGAGGASFLFYADKRAPRKHKRAVRVDPGQTVYIWRDLLVWTIGGVIGGVPPPMTP